MHEPIRLAGRWPYGELFGCIRHFNGLYAGWASCSSGDFRTPEVPPSASNNEKVTSFRTDSLSLKSCWDTALVSA